MAISSFDIPSVLVHMGIAVGLITATIGAFFAVRRVIHLLRPIRLSPGIRRVFDGSGPEQITARVTNVSGEDQVLVSCVALSAYSFRTGVRRLLTNPRASPKLYRVIWYSAMGFSLMDDDPIRLTPKETLHLDFSLSDDPLCQFLTSHLQIEVRTSTGQRFRSKRIAVPEPWRLQSTSLPGDLLHAKGAR